jgi:hypothetical protein
MVMLEAVSSYRFTPVVTPVADTKSDPIVKSLTDKAKAGKDALAALKDAQKKQSQSARDMAYQRVLRVLERIKALKAMKGGDPVQSAKVITQLSKELRSALKAYMATGGKAGDLAASGASTASTPTAAPDTPKPETTASEVKSPINPYAPPGQPLPEDASFLKDIRELVKALKALLLREVNKAQGSSLGDAKADPKVFEEAQTEILRLEKDLDDAQRDLAQAALSSGSHADTTA